MPSQEGRGTYPPVWPAGGRGGPHRADEWIGRGWGRAKDGRSGCRWGRADGKDGWISRNRRAIARWRAGGAPASASVLRRLGTYLGACSSAAGHPLNVNEHVPSTQTRRRTTLICAIRHTVPATCSSEPPPPHHGLTGRRPQKSTATQRFAWPIHRSPSH